MIIPATSVVIQDSNCICQYAADTKKQTERLQVIELDFAIVDVLKKTRWAANIPLNRYSTGRKFPIDQILNRRVRKNCCTWEQHKAGGVNPYPCQSCTDEEPWQVPPQQLEQHAIVGPIPMHSE